MPVTAAPVKRRTAARPPVAVALAGAAVLALALAPAAQAADPDVTISFVSDTSWTVSDANGSVGPSLSLPGNAQLVCLDASTPYACPAGASQYGWSSGGWATDLSSIPDARWIWAPGIDGSTAGANADTYFFQKTINVPGTVVSGTIWIAADDDATIGANDELSGSVTGVTLTSIDLTGQLRTGSNLITIQGRNGEFGDTYQQNPAGVVFGGTITYTPASDPGTGGSGSGGGTEGGGTGSGTSGNPTPRVTMPPTDTLVAPSAAPVDTTPALPGVLLAVAAAGLGALTVASRVARWR